MKIHVIYVEEWRMKMDQVKKVMVEKNLSRIQAELYIQRCINEGGKEGAKDGKRKGPALQK
jgi:hypothetical protein